MSAGRDSFLQRVRLFADLSDEARDLLFKEVQRVQLAAGEYLIREGEQGDDLYVIEEGVLSVSVATDENGSRRVSELVRGECVGEMGLFQHAARSATVRAKTEVSL